MSKSIAAKIATMVRQVQQPSKSGKHAKGFTYSTRDDIYAVLRDLSVTSKLILIPSTKLESLNEIHKSKNGAHQYRAVIRLDVQIIDADTGEEMLATWVGEGIASDETAIQSAATQALRFFLINTFMLFDGDGEVQYGGEDKVKHVQAPPTEPSALENFNACMSSIGITDEEAAKFGAYIAETEEKPSLAKVDPHRLQGYVNKLLEMKPVEAAERVRAKI